MYNMKFTIVYDNPMAAVTQDYKDLQDAIAHADTENNVFCRITGGHVVSGGAIYRRGKGWRVAVNRWRPPEWDTGNGGLVSRTEWVSL